MKTSLLPVLVILVFAVNVRSEDEHPDIEHPDAVVLSDSRTYHLTVGEIEPLAFVTLETRWIFGDHQIPKTLLAAIKKSDAFQPTPRKDLPPESQETIDESRAARWKLEGKEKPKAGASLRYLTGPKRAEIVLLVNLGLDHSLGKDKPVREYEFGDLRVSLDLNDGVITEAQWGEFQLPTADAEGEVKAENLSRVSITGSFDKKTVRLFRCLNRLLPDEASRLLNNLWQYEYTNDSHYGIRLLWTDVERVYHGLMLMEDPNRDPVAFWYSMSGPPWPMKYARMQLAPKGWPLVLRGHEFVGYTEEGAGVFRPVQFVISRK